MTFWRWLRTAEGSGWVETDSSGRPREGARLRDRVPELHEGDRMSGADVARLVRQTSDAPLPERVEQAKEGLYGGQKIPGVSERVREAKRALGLS